MPRSRSRSWNPLAHAFARHISDGVVTETEDLTPRMRRIAITSPALPDKGVIPGQHVRIEINDPLSAYGIMRPSQTLRTYTIWTTSPDVTRFDLLVHRYGGDGIGLRWATAARTGDPVRYWGPMGDFTLRDASHHVFMGDETGTAAFRPLIDALPADATAEAVVESDDHTDEVPLPADRLTRLHRVHRRGRSPVDSVALREAVREWRPDAAPAATAFYLAGEARTGQSLRRILETVHAVPRHAVTVKPFWTPGKVGLHH
ncbi:NADPH-dependent ferric siderophore reductase [Stackebrandtia albiflava]|uniref:NADPH-dependent ferric siderophore reductase n=1 Tax=Stackebrandtia albiflava TaxID=406432 RepID=A0A562V4A2_9ACTN|nr:siderophore-interacting protein [Stackebrandtia albiflava]TWJ12703.1 NADPH-dependent ferric siderophore reductase [Stackebrandtia albiflava]